MKVEYIPLWDVEERWGALAPHLSKALAQQSALTLESVYRQCKEGRAFLWEVSGRAALVTEIQSFAAERICMVVLCGGDGMEEWIDEVDRTLVRHARAFGCRAIMVVGRVGWSRVLPQYAVRDVVMRREL